MANEFRHANAVAGGLSENEYEAVDEHIANNQVANDMLYYNGANWVRATATTIRGLLEHSIIFHVNAFQYPAPGTDWTPQIEGAGLAANKAAKKCWIPLNFLKEDDIIRSYSLLGDMHEEGGDTCTLDCKLVRVNYADPLTTTDIVNGAIVQVDADGSFVKFADNDDETVALGKQYLLELLGTTSNVSANEKIIIMGARVTITRKI